MSYILGIDQSTQSTKALLFDEQGNIVSRKDKKHRQLINEQGHVSHDPIEIYQNTIEVVKQLVDEFHLCAKDIKGVGISNQRETTVVFDQKGIPYCDAIVWQCARASEVVKRFVEHKEEIYDITGLVLSPYFPAAKMVWLKENIHFDHEYYFGTIDTWLIYKLTNQTSFKTDASNASRTQLFDIHTGNWSSVLCDLFGIDMHCLPEVCNSNDCFGYTDFEGVLDDKIPIAAVMGDSHAALFGQGCHEKGQVKVTLGTGSSIMMNIGKDYMKSRNGLTTSLAWKLNDQMEYVFEGNINYAGAIISWLQNDLEWIQSPNDTIQAIEKANSDDETVLVPAFSGLSAPHWNDQVRAMFYNMSRTTTKNEMIKASVESIAYQITDILNAMASDSGLALSQVKADGGPSKNTYLMQFLSDMARCDVLVSKQEELSAIGVAYMAGLKVGLYQKEDIFAQREYQSYSRKLEIRRWKELMDRWYDALAVLLK
ncbi:MAG: glycerol kinase [Floccifex sp.]